MKDLALWHAHRAADLQVFWLGPPVQRVSWDSKVQTVGQFSLHIQCAWRIRSGDRILVGYRDVFVTEDDTEGDKTATGSNRQPITRRDFLLESLINERADPLRVNRVDVDDLAGLSLLLDEGLVLEIFPDASGDDAHSESWRFFEQNSERHLVIMGSTALFDGWD